MEESAASELQLSEEQLQAITGGCGQCLEDLLEATHYNGIARAHIGLAGAAMVGGQHNEAMQYMDVADDAYERAQALIKRVEARQRTPEHNTSTSSQQMAGKLRVEILRWADPRDLV